MEIIINPNLANLPTVDYRSLNDFQEGLKTLEKVNYDKLRKSLEERGLLAPFFLWPDPATNKNYIIDGHQRKRVFVLEKVQPYEMPYIYVPGETKEEAKQNLLVITSQYGKVSEQGFNEFVFDLPQEWIQSTIHFDALAKQFEQTMKPALTAFPEDVELKAFTKTHILISFPPDKLIEIQEHLDKIIEKPYVEYEQASN